MVCDVPPLAGPRERWDLARFAESSLAEEAFVYGTKASGRMGRFQPRMLSCHSHIWRPINVPSSCLQWIDRRPSRWS